MLRYAIDGSVVAERHSNYDVVIVGAGIAGLYCALNLSPSLKCCVFAKETIDISNSWLAQGGIAVVTAPDDDPELHFKDTIVAGAGLCDGRYSDGVQQDGKYVRRRTPKSRARKAP